MRSRQSGAEGARTCPRCDGQGEVTEAVVSRTGERISVCDECNAAWMAGEDVSADRWTDFGTIMRERGLAPEWHEIETMPQAAATDERKTTDGI